MSVAHPDFVEDVLDVVARIPAGKVMTYGDVAHVLGSRAARMVGQVLAYYGHQVAWWRVVPVTGKPPKGHTLSALEHYRAEGTPLIEHTNTPEGYKLQMSLARLKFDHEMYDGALARHRDLDESEHP